MILIFGGTTEGRQAVMTVDEAEQPFYYSTKGNDQTVVSRYGMRRYGAMEINDIVDFCRSHGVRLLVDAAHPFATLLHQHIIAAAHTLGILAIRYERRYAERSGDLVWCEDYTDAVSRLENDGIHQLLALTGVQTISKLSAYWRNHVCWFRILHRAASMEKAQKAGFPNERIVYYEEGGASTLALIRQKKPQAILTKESGVSGGFDEKVAAAREAGVKVFVVKRPALPEGFIIVNGPFGLRRAIERCLPDFYPLKTGITTGTCAAAAAKAALKTILKNKTFLQIDVLLPDGESLPVDISSTVVDKSSIYTTSKDDSSLDPDISPLSFINGCLVTCTVVKDAGDDPDITNGIEISATVRLSDKKADETQIEIRGGEGVGTVTLPGLGLPVGGPAINVMPQQMIRTNLMTLLKRGVSLHDSEVNSDVVWNHDNVMNHDIIVTISVPQGREIAARTFNPRIGVQGGISIIGTSGIVKPFSSEAFVNSIRKEMQVAVASESPVVVINSGAKSEGFLRKHYEALPSQAFVHYGNFIGETIRIASELNVRSLLMGVMIGKAVKLAEGHLDTHSKKVVMNKSFIKGIAEMVGCNEVTLRKINGMTIARELWTILSEGEMQRFSQELINRCHACCDPLLPDGRLEIRLISEDGRLF